MFVNVLPFSSPQAVLFDLDGVLVDACEWHYEALNQALVESGYPAISREDHVSTYNGLPTRMKLQMLGVPEKKLGFVEAQKQTITLDIIGRNAKMMPEKAEMHRFLKSKGVKIACVTNSIAFTARKMLESTGQMEFIDVLVTNEMVERNKPYPDCYNLAIDRLEVDPLKCICVEDSPKGIQAAVASRAGHLWVVTDTTKVTKDNYIKFVERKP